eukprot:76039-Chlamydomonas_euryale.AAC.1
MANWIIFLSTWIIGGSNSLCTRQPARERASGTEQGSRKKPEREQEQILKGAGRNPKGSRKKP